MKDNFLFTLRQIYRVLDSEGRKKFTLIAGLSFVQSLVEVLSLSLILPLLYIAQFPESVISDRRIRMVYDMFGFESSNQFLVTLAVFIVFVFVLKGIFGVCLVAIQTKFSFNTAISSITAQLKGILKRDLLFFKQHNSNVMMQDVVTVPIEFSSFILQPALLIISEILVLCIICVSVAFFEPIVFGGLVLVLVPPIYLFYKMTQKLITKLGVEKNSLRPKAYKNIFGILHGIEMVKVTGKESYFESKTIHAFRELFEKMSRLNVLENIPFRIIEITAISAVCILVCYSVVFTSDTTTLLPLLVVFATAAYRLLPSINRIVSQSVRIQSAHYVFERLDNLSFADRSRFSAKNEVDIESISFNDSIVLKELTFRYPKKSKDSIHSLNLSISKGEVIGFIGKSGGGKSTLIKLILNLLKPDIGSVNVDGVELNEHNNRSWQSKIGYVQQADFMLDGTIEENVAFGEFDIDQIKLRNSIEAANLTEFVDNLPNGIKSGVGEFGSSISGGQQQRISLARALYRDAEILVFDEATSALDGATEMEIMKTIANLKTKNLTVIIIAHRISSLDVCDRIIELEEGRIKREISYKELIRSEAGTQ